MDYLSNINWNESLGDFTDIEFASTRWSIITVNYVKQRDALVDITKMRKIFLLLNLGQILDVSEMNTFRRAGTLNPNTKQSKLKTSRAVLLVLRSVGLCTNPL